MNKDFYVGWVSAALTLNDFRRIRNQRPYTQEEVIKKIIEATDMWTDPCENESVRDFYRGKAKGFLSAFGF